MMDPFWENLSEHINCLGKIFDYPRRANQRLVEQMTFLPDGGRRWVRTLQIQLPLDAAPSGSSLRAVSLGVFKRRRLPDLVASDATGARLNLLTRNQHGILLVGYVLFKHFKDFPTQTAALEAASATPERERYNRLVGILYDTVTTVGDIADPQRRLCEPTAIYEYLLRSFTPIPEDISDRVIAFRSNFEELLYFTHYLCWVRGEPGEVINLQTTHTTADSGQRPEWSKEDLGVRGVERRANRFRAYGLAPLKCEWPTPSNGFASSYYFTLEPPLRTEVTFLDWTSGNSLRDDKQERDSALDSVHFHYRHDSKPAPSERGQAVRAFIRCSTHGHKQIAAGAALNFIFVILVASGGFSGVVGGSAQTWLLVTPTILTAYIADQQRHYYAYPTRRQRGILWIYLGISVGFLVTISFRLAEGSKGYWSLPETGAAWLLLVSSAAVFVWYALLGYSFRGITKWWATQTLRGTDETRARLDKALDAVNASTEIREKAATMLPTPRRVYERVVYNYCKIILGSVVAASFVTVLGIILLWDPSPMRTKPVTAQYTGASGMVTLRTWPSNDCKGCNLDLRFVPSEKSDQPK